MTWIRTIKAKDYDQTLRDAMAWRKLYPKDYSRDVAALNATASNADAAGISDSHTLIPGALLHAFATFGELLSPDLPLSRQQHEMIATVVSVANNCHY